LFRALERTNNEPFPKLNDTTMNALSKNKGWLALATVLLIVGAAYFLRSHWWPLVSNQPTKDEQTDRDSHAGHDHAHAGHDEGTSLELSEKELRNIGFQPLVIELQPFTKSISVPAMVVERAGRSQIDVTAPMTGIVTKVYVVEGEAVTAGQRLCDMQLTHEDLVTAQREFLRLAEELDVVRRELERLKSIGEGVIAGKRVLETEYEKQKLEAALHAEREGLLLHGLSEAQVAEILESRSLLKSLTIAAPQGTNDCAAQDSPRSEHLFTVQKIAVKPGQQIEAGASICVLADHCRLYIEGRAFEQDASALNDVASKNQKVSARRISHGVEKDEENLEILYVADRVEADTRAFHFYLSLPNTVVRDQKKEGHRFIGWKYKPGQRFEVRIPVKQLEGRIVLPVDAVVEEGVGTFVFQQNGDHFDRVEVHVEDRGQDHVLIADDGLLFPGDVVAATGAYQMHLALKNKSGGAIDPHAGHSH
jgi:multidrug efflux pump subunit AcrA (membrane-fusion protein)